ncbi:hypothetical protein DIU31_021360 [Mucilaginibacter rubeus]|uniref:Uncharacterized protein n=1 Tax=Mucilaginibacter rubeus TaxID=2027860 RepID=A0AAE6JID8_9SPHI|nr:MULTISPECIES: hypothetical protein [Mucilaginibacter]QEM05938.1 hypothetical protein DIU31_021360 [Mucilaginibacter rubeus]QEM18518.1 hypothetical protein DIU38_021575 [Mucilaginibacter gossypii]QTE44942.1 hypothetical protein J3L19_06145 [Mucilaginibacter rubeus]QTE51539.1 hypothetical protein J3L21_06120 [Mucilaginibacter rubeus]QTE56626.1 hypothetical protein J3L23_31360 [Mucilaginibacter rubeus]
MDTTITYIIDQSKLNNLIKRMLMAAFNRTVIIGISVFVSQSLLYPRNNWGLLIISFGVSTTLLILIMTLGVRKRLKRTYESFKLVLNIEGVEAKAEMMPYRSIPWQYLEVREQRNGIIDLCDNRVSNFSRRWSGKGWIRLQPEMEDRDTLLHELAKRGHLVV